MRLLFLVSLVLVGQLCSCLATKPAASPSPPAAAKPAEVDFTPQHQLKSRIPIQYRRWPPSADKGSPVIAKQMINASMPVVMLNSPAKTEWLASSLWTTGYLSSRLPMILAEESEPGSSVFHVWSTGKPLKSTKLSREFVSSAGDLKDLIVKNPDKHYMSKLAVAAHDQLLNQVFLDFLNVNDEHFPKAYLRISGAGTTIVDTRYDLFESFHFMLFGHLQYTLFSPDDAGKLYPYPAVHALHGHAQANVSNINTAKFSNAAQATAYEVVLQQGELLYIPSFWSYKVHAETQLVYSIEVEVLGRDELAIEEIYAVALPFQRSWTPDRWWLTVRWFLTSIISGVLRSDEVKRLSGTRTALADEDVATTRTFFADLLAQRYVNQLDRVKASKREGVRHYCPADFEDLTMKYPKNVLDTDSHLLEQRNKAVAGFAKIHRNAVRVLVLQNYVESVLTSAIRTELDQKVAHLPYIMKSCF